MNWWVIGAVGLVSLITMSATAVYFWFLGFLTLMATGICAAFFRLPERRAAVLTIGASTSVGLLAGPVAFLILVVAT